MSFNFYMPTQILSGRGVIAENAEKFNLGKRAMIVSGRHSARACGALADVERVLSAQAIAFDLYDQIVENPPVSVCEEGGRRAAAFQADFIIAIGGGSPIDASKAIASYATNPGVSGEAIFTATLQKPLPIIAIPTTAGTGSEVDAVGVLTLDGQNVKRTFRSSETYPKIAFLDPTYTESLNREYTVSTALDALCHCIESYLSPKSTEISRMYALHGATKIYSALGVMEELSREHDEYLEEAKPFRYALMTGACAGGVAINTTGTGFNHPLGYNLTLYKGIPHGRACATFMGEYFDYNRRHELGESLIDAIGAALQDEPDTIAANMIRWADVKIGSRWGNALTADEIGLYIENVGGAGNYANSPYVITPHEMKSIYTKLFS